MTSPTCRGLLGINNDKLQQFSDDDLIPPVLHIPLGLVQKVWDDFDDYVTNISHYSNPERNTRTNILLLGENDKVMTNDQKSLTQRAKELTEELKVARSKHNTLEIGTQEYFESIEIMNETFALREELGKHQQMQKSLKNMSVQEIKQHKKSIEEYDKKHTFFENSCHRTTKEVLATYRIYRQAYMSRCFIGPHVQKLMQNAEAIMLKIETNLKANCHPQVDHAEVHQKCVSVRDLLKVLNTVSSYTKRTTQSTDEDMDALVEKLESWEFCGEGMVSVAPPSFILLNAILRQQ